MKSYSKTQQLSTIQINEVNNLIDEISSRQKNDLGQIESDLKPDGTLITSCDRWSDATIVRGLSEITSGEGVLSEEGLKIVPNSSAYWIVDPLDGTQAFLEGKREFSISVAIVENGLPISGIIFSPSTNEMFEAEKDKGSWKNKKKVLISKYKKLEECKMMAFKPMFSHPAWSEPWPKMYIENRNSII